jgi:hypothetical protein
MRKEVRQNREHLRLDVTRGARAAELVAAGVELDITELVEHRCGSLSRRDGRRNDTTTHSVTVVHTKPRPSTRRIGTLPIERP